MAKRKKWGDKKTGERYGYTYRDAHGRTVYVIHKQVDGTRYEVSTRAYNEREAIDQLNLFLKNPEEYVHPEEPEPPPPPPEALILDKKLQDTYLAYSEKENNSREWRLEQQSHLIWWAERLYGIDLRACPLAKIQSALDAQGTKSKYHRRTVIKGLYTWLRTVAHKITHAEDPTVGGAIQVSPPKEKDRPNKAISRENVEKARKKLKKQWWRDALDLQRQTGWHLTEVARFANEGSIELPTPSQRIAGMVAVLVVRHKSGRHHRTGVSTEILAAAKRLQSRPSRSYGKRKDGTKKQAGRFSIRWYRRAVRKACKDAKIPVFNPGSLRHSVASWAVNEGHDVESVASFLGHRSLSTTLRFYATHVVPANPMLVGTKRAHKARP